MATQCRMPRGYDGPRTLQHRALVACCLVLSALLLVALPPGRSESQMGMTPEKTTPQEILTHARAFEAEKHYDQAIALYEDILTRHPVDVEVRVALARVQAWHKHFAEARRLYASVLNEDAQHLDARRGLADTLYWSGEYTAALQHYEIVFAATADPAIAQRLEAVRAELARPTPAASLRTPIGPRESSPTLPYRDYVKLGYSRFTSTATIPDEQAGLLEAAKPLGTRTLVGRLEVLDRFGLHDVELVYATPQLFSLTRLPQPV